MEFISAVMSILTSNGGAFATVLALLLVAFWGVHWVTKKITQMSVEHESRIAKFDKVDDAIGKIREDITFIKGRLELFGMMQDLAKAHSPLSLTEKGKDVAKEIKAELIIAENWDNIYSELENNIKDKNAYDIQQYCIEKVSIEPERFFSEKDLLQIKQYAFLNGKPIQYYAIVFAIIMRDKYFQVKNIAIDEVDKHDPSKH